MPLWRSADRILTDLNPVDFRLFLFEIAVSIFRNADRYFGNDAFVPESQV